MFLSFFSNLSYAPWCPACRSLESTWDLLVDWSKDKGLKFGGVDVTTESGMKHLISFYYCHCWCFFFIQLGIQLLVLLL